MELWEIRNTANYKQTAHSLSRKSAGNISVGSQQLFFWPLFLFFFPFFKKLFLVRKKADLTKKHFYSKCHIVSFGSPFMTGCLFVKIPDQCVAKIIFQ